MDIATYRKITGAKGYGRSKYNAKRTAVGDLMFDSKGEAERWSELQLLLKAGEIKNLTRQVTIPCLINGRKVFSYRPDFVYLDTRTGQNVIEDFKGMQTDVFKLKRKILEAQGMTILITERPKKKKS